jgi:hypothetical protein
MSNSPIEILGTRESRWSVEEKLRIVAESEEPGAIVRAVPARHDVYPYPSGGDRLAASSPSP